MISILKDSTCDLAQVTMNELGIERMPMYIQVDGRVYRDLEEIDPYTLFKRVAGTGKYPTTSAPSPEDIVKFFSDKAPAIYIGVSSKLSSTFRNAQMEVCYLGEKSIDLVDTLSISTGYAQIVTQAAKWQNEGMDFRELGENIRKLIKRTLGIFILDTLDYLSHGEKCKAIEYFVASILKTSLFLQILPDGTLGVLHKVRGSRVKAVRALRDHSFEEIAAFQINRIFITHLACDAMADYLAQEIQFARVGCVLATHSSPKPIGIAYEVI